MGAIWDPNNKDANMTFVGKEIVDSGFADNSLGIPSDLEDSFYTHSNLSSEDCAETEIGKFFSKMSYVYVLGGLLNGGRR